MRAQAMRSGWIVLLLVGCSASDESAADTAASTAGAAGAVQASPTISLADIAGTWNVRSSVVGNDSMAVEYQFVATADRSGWSVNFPNREPIPVRILAVEGDSVVSEAGPFESQLRKNGVQVRVHQVTRLRDGRLVGTTRARYEVSGPDTVANLTFEGTRAP